MFYDVDRVEYDMRLLLPLLFILSGCQLGQTDLEKQLNLKPLKHIAVQKRNNGLIYKQFYGAFYSIIKNMPFAKNISVQDKIMLEENLQNTLNDAVDKEFEGITVSSKARVLNYYAQDGYLCREFELTLFFDEKIYVIKNKAARIGLWHGNGFWISQDQLDDYIQLSN